MFGEMFPSCCGILAEAICTTIQPEFRVPTDSFLLYAHDRLRKIYGSLSFNLSFVQDHLMENVHTEFFLLFAYDHLTKVYAPLSFILSFEHHHSTKIYGLLSFVFFCALPFDQKLRSTLICFFICFCIFLYMYTTIRSKVRFLINLFILFVHNHLTKICGSHWFIFPFPHNHST